MNKKELEKRKRFRQVADEFLRVVKKEVESAVFLDDMDRLEGLVSIVHIHMDRRKIRI